MVPTNIVRVNMFVSSISGLPADEITIGEIAQDKGYHTGLIGLPSSHLQTFTYLTQYI